ncbi:MAG: hypothetical protein R3C10_19040 [Pirellulales bacterium]
MSEYLAIDFDTHQLAGARARLSNQRVRVESVIERTWPAELDPWADPVAAGQWLAGELRDAGLTASEVLVSLPREDVVVRQLDVPDVPDEALPNLVRLQAETKSSSSLGGMVLDFLPLPRSPQAAGRQVLMITIAQSRLGRLRELTTAAGLELASVGISAVATTELVARAETHTVVDRAAAALLVSRTAHRVEIALVRDEHLLFTHSSQLADTDASSQDAATLAEVRRSLGALSRLDAELQVSRAWVIGAAEETASLCQAMSKQLDCPVAVLSPLKVAAVSWDGSGEPPHQAQLAGPVGMLLAMAGPTVETVDLLKPRRPVVRPDRRRLKTGLAIAAAAGLVALAFGYTYVQTRARAGQIEETQERLTQASEVVDRAAPTLAAAKLIDEWDDRGVDCLYQLTELNRQLPGTDRLYLRNLRFNPLPGDAVAQLQADGRARSRSDVEQLEQRLRNHEYRVRPHEKTTVEDDDKDYPVGFVLDLGITAETNAHVDWQTPAAHAEPSDTVVGDAATDATAATDTAARGAEPSASEPTATTPDTGGAEKQEGGR